MQITGYQNYTNCEWSRKQNNFRKQIRQQQILSYKNQVRLQHHLVNYQNPQQTIHRIQENLLSILTSQSQLYSINNLSQIIMTCKRIINNYQHCAILSTNKIIQNILIAILKSPNSEKVLLQWLQLVFDTLKSWQCLWNNFHFELPNILWGIILDLPNFDQIIKLSCSLLQNLKQKYNISIDVDESQIYQIFEMTNFSPIIIRILRNSLTKQIQQQLQNERLIQRLSTLLEEKNYSIEIISLLQKFCFVSPQLLSKINRSLQNRYQDEKWYDDTYKMIKILYQQMYYSQQELVDLGKRYSLFGKYVDSILNNDI